MSGTATRKCRIVDVAEHTIDLTKIVLVGPVGDGMPGRYVVHLDGGYKIALYDNNRHVFRDEDTLVPRAHLIRMWMEATR